MTVSISGTGGITFDDSSVQNTAATGFGFKNRIINGAMVIDQRNAGAAVTSSGSFPVDRFRLAFTMDGACSAQQVAEAPAGFINSLKFTTTTADTNLGTSQTVLIGQRIEGLNVADLGWGSVNAQTVTLSFWVRSSLTGTFGGSVENSAENRSYPFAYTISAANTWEQKSITIPGDTTGTWLTTNGIGIRVTFSMGAGSNFVGTAGAWAAADYISSTGATSVIGTLNATWQVTGVQLEKGSTATSFDYRPYGTELALCQRYFYRRTSLVAGGVISVLQAYSTTAAFGNIANLPVTMRATPTASVSAVGDFNLATSNSSNAAFTAINLDSTTKDNIATGNVSGSSGLVAGNATCLTSANSTGYINASAEL